MVEQARRDPSKTFVHPIIDWGDSDVWGYIRERRIAYCSLYDEGFDRLGCVLCPMVEGWRLQRQIQRWPKIVAAWRSMAHRVYAYRGERGLDRRAWASGDAYFDWWLTREGLPKENEQQATFDDCLVPFSD
jgi:phosphoadenosine phosphosulfate reductase